MPTYRSQERIIADVLSSANHNMVDENGVGITHLLSKANLSYSRLSNILRRLVSQGLLEEIDVGKAQRYRTSDRGHKFLRAYGEFEEFAESFGFQL